MQERGHLGREISLRTPPLHSPQPPHPLPPFSSPQIKYLLHELEEAAIKTSKNITSDAAGSPHNLDEAWGIWDGRNGLCGATMYEKAETLAQSLGLVFDGRAVLNTAAAVNFGDALVS